ncbi:hypothetical protein TNIN_380701 [Trichonephila inaurata madagascariensis]|uniref:Uncharacterized protein n=1 Tax=Trichonephila inaurata madagascariensis TaxID=2747483 RepID=A0A8X7C459_9ARAC|nr:hypothetical protein TNIN_380701 [Trichonephila inaurata madagascariensis]
MKDIFGSVSPSSSQIDRSHAKVPSQAKDSESRQRISSLTSKVTFSVTLVVCDTCPFTPETAERKLRCQATFHTKHIKRDHVFPFS